MAATAAIAATGRTRPRPTPHWGIAGAAGAAAAGLAAAQGRAGRQPVRPWRTPLPRCGHSRRSATAVEKRAPLPDFRDVFLCHAWDDRGGAAKELHDLLQSRGVSVWFSEKDVALGTSLLREIDKGLAKSRVGIVLVTPALLRRLQGEGIADKELSALLARDLLVPIVHDTTYEALREVSPLLGSRSGLSTAEAAMADVAAKLAELVAIQ
jgi:TIR domain